MKRDLETGSVQRVVRNAIEKVSLQQQIEEQRQALKNFAQMLVHDLSAPIQLMRGFSGLISNAVDNEEYGSLDEYCDHLEISGKRLQELIDTLDEYNKVSGGDVTFEPVKLETAFDDAVHNLSILIEERGAKVTKDELPEVIGNRPLLAQLFQNLITNALKYCEAEVPQVHVSASEKNGRWRIAVRDNGIGIADEHSKEIFSPFKRLHKDGDKKYSGTGLGLSTCKKIVERHDGKIWCRSNAGQGTKFYFTLMPSEKAD